MCLLKPHYRVLATYHFLWPSKSKKPGFGVLHFPTFACEHTRWNFFLADSVLPGIIPPTENIQIWASAISQEWWVFILRVSFILKPHINGLEFTFRLPDHSVINLVGHSLVYSERTGTTAGPCWPSEPDLVHGRLQTQTPAQAPRRPVGPPFPWRYNQILSNPGPSRSLSLLHRAALLCRAGQGPYLSQSQCPERTTATQKPLLLLYVT